MVKRAAIDTAPLLTAEERVNSRRSQRSPTAVTLTDGAGQVAGATSGSTSSQNLSIDREDFDAHPGARPTAAAGAGPTGSSTASSPSCSTN